MNRLETLAGDSVLGPYLADLAKRVDRRNKDIFRRNKKGIDLLRALERLPDARPSSIDVSRARIRIGESGDLDDGQRAALLEALQGLKPWRKGPFDIFGIPLDSEWNSSIKWDRLSGHLGTLAGKRVLDIGSSCGYYLFRLAAQQHELAIGIEPYPNFYVQFLALSRYLAFPRVYCLPLKLEEMPAMRRCFDTVLCMGILYHRRSPLDTLAHIQGLMVPGGQLVLETLVLEGEKTGGAVSGKTLRQNEQYFLHPDRRLPDPLAEAVRIRFHPLRGRLADHRKGAAPDGLGRHRKPDGLPGSRRPRKNGWKAIRRPSALWL